MIPAQHALAALRKVLAGRANSGRGQHGDMSLYGCMTSAQDYALQRCAMSGSINLSFRCLDCGPSPDGSAPVMGQRNRDGFAGLGCSDAEVGALARDGMLRAAGTGR